MGTVHDRSELKYELTPLAERFYWRAKDACTAFVDLADKYDIKFVAVYGSVARGEMNPYSDIDILVVAGNCHGARQVNMLVEAEDEYGINPDEPEVSVVVLSPDAFNGDDPTGFIERVYREMIVVWRREGVKV